MRNAAIRLPGLQPDAIALQAREIILGQLRQVISSMNIEAITGEPAVLLEKIQASVEPQLEQIGLVLVNVNILDVTTGPR